jgi:hypothetical protein
VDTLCIPVETVRETVEHLAEGSEAIQALRIERAMHGLTMQKLANSEDANVMLRRSNEALEGAEGERRAEAEAWKQAHKVERRKRKGERWMYLLGGVTVGYLVAR